MLDDDGFGYESWVLAGMEWAAHSGAKAVNMSLGGGPTDGTDALSLGLEALSAQTGTLFVVAGGNDGELGAYTIGSPGTAEAALTVGAVGRDESLAPFSSRGPRLGDNAVKPDITAPGVGIVAARAAGTAMGDVVDDHYTAASGTSMATPHVAGAVAILAQQHPDWTGSQLKDALSSTSLTANGLSVFEQGGGRVDVARAVKQKVFATGTLNLGAVEDGQAPVSKVVTYTNAGTTPVSLKLALDAKSLAGVPAADGIRLGKSTVDVPAGGQATVTITGDPAKLAAGTYSGRLTATADGVVVHTALGADKTAPKHKVTLTALDLQGKPTVAPWLLMYGEDYRFDVNTWLGGDSLTVELGAGVYYLTAQVNGVREQRLRLPGRPAGDPDHRRHDHRAGRPQGGEGGDRDPETVGTGRDLELLHLPGARSAQDRELRHAVRLHPRTPGHPDAEGDDRRLRVRLPLVEDRATVDGERPGRP